MQEKITQRLQEAADTLSRVQASCALDIAVAVETICQALRSGNKVLIFGNGGSAADSQHFAAELVGRFQKERPALAAISLTTNASSLTALSNDYSYNIVFSRQIEALGVAGDVAIGISTSGGAENVRQGLTAARARGMRCIALTGEKGTSLKQLTDVCICAPSASTPRIQEAHITIIHIVCELVEDTVCA